MAVKQAIRASHFFVILLFLCFCSWSLLSVFLFDNISLYQENGLLENAQVLILFITFFVFFLLSVNQKRNDKLIVTFFALLSFNFILREIDVEEFDIPAVFILFGSGVGRKALLAMGFLGIFFFAMLNVKYYAGLSKSLLGSRVGTLFFMAAVFLFAGGFFEEAAFLHHTYFEELSELTGYILLLLASLAFIDKSLNEHGWVSR